MLKRFFEKHETLMCILLIALYIVINAFCVNSFGSDDYRSALINTAFSAVLILLAVRLKRVSYYGLTKPQNVKKLLYFLPLVLIVSVNLWSGININNTAAEILFHTLVMLNVGFAEEIIFRGFLFKMMEKDNVKTAVIVSSVTFGIGHIVNLFNGNELVPTLLQVCYATAIGYLFVVIFRKSKSIIPCIVAHALNNSLSVFNEENFLSRYIIPAFLVVAPILYAVYINKVTKEQKSPDERPIE
ncbi:MAG: CPBP family intramembrane metalloprotease [Clostridia bacterium]|nr:CPBP family intramembrane metalloprotease [Clostridia bacterium]